MKKIITIVMIGMMSLISASEISDRFEVIYVASCSGGYQDKGGINLNQFVGMCVCTWQGIEKKYSDSELSLIDRGAANPDLINDFKSYNEERASLCYSWMK